MGGGKERKKNGGSPTTDQVKDRRKRLKQKFSQTGSAIKHILSKKLSAQRNAEYFIFGSSGYSVNTPHTIVAKANYVDAHCVEFLQGAFLPRS
jgi:hypothetical protein